MKILYISGLLCFFSMTLQSQNPAADVNDSLTLVKLYNVLDGPNWSNNNNWLTDSVYKWYGIELDANGKVTEIQLEYNNLKGEIPSEIGNLSKLRMLSLSTNQLSGNIPAEIGNLKALVYLYLYENDLGGNIPVEIGNLPDLYELLMANNDFTGSLPSEISNLTHLGRLDVSENQLSGTIPQEIGNLSQMQELRLYDNQFTGHIPPEIGNLTKLTWLDLSRNQLSGTIPPEIGNLTNLVGLYLFDNQLQGSIPVEIGNLKQLNLFLVHLNKLSGNIPPEIGNLTNLTDFVVSWNQLSGSVPQEFGNLVNLRKLRIEENQIDGLPDLSALTSLTSCVVNYNRLTFEDLEPNIGLPGLNYDPQARIGTIQHFTPDEGEKVDLSISTGGTANTYQWYKNGGAIDGATDSTYSITSYRASEDAGTYFCKVKNTIVTQLTLTTQNYYVGVDISSFNITASTEPSQGGSVSGTGTYYDGDTATITAMANEGYQFQNWSEFGSIVSTDTSLTFVVSGERSFVANFTQITARSDIINSQDEITIYPNPSNGRFHIKTNLDIKNILIYNAGGVMVYETSFHPSLNISYFPKGIYFIKFISRDNRRIMKRFLIKD